MSTVLITGGTGMIGTAISRVLLDKGYQVIILTRTLPSQPAKVPGVEFALWDIPNGKIDPDAVSRADYIIHLAGAGVADKRWSAKRKKEIVESRTMSGKLIASTLSSVPNKVKAVVSASAIGWYGPDPVIPNPLPFIETDPAHDSFLGNTCREWESSISPVKEEGRRLVILRTGIVLSAKGGALEEFRKPLKFGVATVLGSGKQVISWIHLDDLVNMYVKGLEDEAMNGVYNAVSPNPVSNRQFTEQLAASMNKRPMFIRVPEFALKIVLGEMSVEVLKSATVNAGKISRSGFEFRFPSLKEALDDLAIKAG